MQCLNCGYENLAGMRFCGQCGTRLGRVCTACGYVNPPDHVFCGQCGTRLSEIPVPTERSAAWTQLRLQPPSIASGRTPIRLEGERRLATVVIVDVVGSTNVLERIGTEAWVEAMNRVLQILEAEVYYFGGAVDQFRGDGLVAFFGAKSAFEDDPERAVLAALAMHRAIVPIANELAEREGVDLRLRVGVNTGEVIVASIGDDRHHAEDTAMGEAVALAARMESAADPGTVLVSENTYHLVESRFEWESLGQITVRGISQPIPVYRPLVPRAEAARAQGMQTRDFSVPLIGRETEFKNLNSAVENLRAGQGGIVVVTGDAGMGKSPLIANVRQHAVRDDALLAKAVGIEQPLGALTPRSLTWLQGHCRPYDQSSPYSMWLDMLRSWLDVREGEPETETCGRLCEQAEALWGDEWTEHHPYLATLLSLPLEDVLAERIRHLNAEGRRQQLFVTMRSWAEAMAKQRPLVLAFEDVHWADTTSLELLDYCLPLCDHEPLLWLIVFRPDHTAAVWGLLRRIETEHPDKLKHLTLSSLTRTQGEKVVDRLIGPEVLPMETRARLLERAEGNPYYIEEFINALIREGVLERDAQTGQCKATRTVESLDLPDSLQNLLLARIDRLSPEERRVLQMAGVIGPVFWSNVLQALVGDGSAADRGTLFEHLSALQRAQLIEEHGPVADLGTEYYFQSNLVRDVAYERLLSVQRVSCHRKVADALEQIFGEKVLARYYSLLAYHYRQAGVERKELFYTLLAAEEARGIYANVEALEHYGRALQLLDEIATRAGDASQLYAIHTQQFEVLNGRREVYYLNGDYAEGWADALALLPLARKLDDDPVWMIDALLEQPGVGYFRSSEEVLAGVPMAEEALALSRQMGDRRREMRSLSAIAGQRYYLNDPTWKEMGGRALEMARELGDKRYEALILTGIGSVYVSSDPQRSTEYLEAAQPIIEALDDKMVELDLLDVIGMQLESSGDYYRRLKECHEKQIEISREIGHRPMEAKALMFYGQIQSLYLGDYEAGLSVLQESLNMSEGSAFEAFPLLRFAQIRILQGRFGDAESILERVRHIGEQHMHDMGRAGLSLVSTILCNALGDEEHLQRALELTTQTYTMSAENLQLSQQYQMVSACEASAAHLGLAHVLADAEERQHHLHLALESSQLALDIYQSFGFVRPIECVSEEILYRHSLALRANGREAEADEFLRRAYNEMMRKHDLIPADSDFRRTFLENIQLHREIGAAVQAVL